MDTQTEPTALQQLQETVAAIRDGGERLAQIRAEIEAANAPYDRIIYLLRAMADRVGQIRDANPHACELAITANSLSCDLAWQEAAARKLALTAWQDGEFEARKTLDLNGARVQIRDTTRREITDPIAFIDQARHHGVYDKLVKGIKVSVNTSAFNHWVDLVQPSSVVVETETAAYVRLE